jgi:hypothetical protein
MLMIPSVGAATKSCTTRQLSMLFINTMLSDSSFFRFIEQQFFFDCPKVLPRATESLPVANGTER